MGSVDEGQDALPEMTTVAEQKTVWSTHADTNHFGGCLLAEDDEAEGSASLTEMEEESFSSLEDELRELKEEEVREE